jgi:hypothetical protein
VKVTLPVRSRFTLVRVCELPSKTGAGRFSAPGKGNAACGRRGCARRSCRLRPAPLRAADIHRDLPEPIALEIEDDLQRSRLTVFFRFLLALPHYLWMGAWSLLAFAAAVVQWPILLARGRPARSLHRFCSAYLEYATHLAAYLLLGAEPFPPFWNTSPYPVTLVAPPAATQRRWKTLLRAVLVVPALVFSEVLDVVAGIVAILAWFVCVAIGRIPKGMRDLNAYILRYRQQTAGYLLLVTDGYPRLESGERYLPKRA